MAPKVKETSRFEPPVASITYDRQGRPVYGVRNVPSRVPLTGQFEAQKTLENEAASQRQQMPPAGLRSAARTAMEEEWARRKAAEEAAPPIPQAPHVHYAQPQEKPQVQSKRIFYGSELSHAQRDHLGVNLVPVPPPAGRPEEDADPAAAAPEAGDPGSQEMQDRVAAARELQAKLCVEYPHGIPKLVLAQLRAEGMLTLADLPSLGFASSASNAAF
ncbi:hypothetical protein CHLRE_14g615200v5 [Chlamydomonas reinhardtii]|uniref:Uncharacterized protein n=1 Tax=Chlamydomonas reinhardtii TaxID=3055 RepID=A8JAR1_CHLRE|nr:uncharacterized protein CHLRE_14g615200v5 [Chlamydomonas reinhardtii]PNW73005.1 hypothetical protein CHLRE_14g615200v5 [Chlamydomonas reinhardtii]|eukprot:XP_001699003.1 predicted protein [Chlamydomonas reinhardtii]